MKKSPLICSICLLLWLLVASSCQSTVVEDLANNSEVATSADSLQENEITGEPELPQTPTRATMPIVTGSPAVVATSTSIVTQIPTAVVHIISDPERAFASVIDNELSGETPISWTLPPGTYSVTLSLTGYEDWVKSLKLQAGSQITLTPALRQLHTITAIEDLSGPLWNLQWAVDGQALTYSLSDEQWPHHVRSLSTYQTWWRYDVSSSTKEALPPPQTRVTNPIREMLGICPFPLPETLPYPCSSNLNESPTSNRIVFRSEKLDSNVNTWMADIDGSNLIPLNILDSPQEVMWSSDGQWLLMGIYWGVDNSNLYYLVSSDGTFVANLEELTSTSHFRVQGPKPAFSPDGQKLAFVGIETDGEPWNGQPWSPEKLDHEEAYNLYVLDLNTLEYELVSSRFGVIQWASDGNGLYILDGTAITVLGYLKYLDSGAGVRYADLYYIDLTQETYPEQKLADDIPVNIPYGVWAYSPEAQAMAGIFYLERPVFGILSLK